MCCSRTQLAAWARLFEEEYGQPPSDADCHQSSTWTALNEKAKFYKKLLGSGERSFTTSPDKRHRESASTPGFRSTSRRDDHDTKRAHSRRERSESPAKARWEKVRQSRVSHHHDDAHGERATSRKSHRSKGHDPSFSGGREHSMRRREKSERGDTKRGGGGGGGRGTSRRSASRGPRPTKWVYTDVREGGRALCRVFRAPREYEGEASAADVAEYSRALVGREESGSRV